MIKVAICDDNIMFTSEIEKLIVGLGEKYNLIVDTDVFFDGEDLLKSINQGELYDLLYLDIEMKRCSGIEVAEHIRAMESDIVLIYVSNYESYLKELFEFEPFRFIKKPIQREQFEKYFLQAIQRIQNMQMFFEYKENKKICKVLMKDILYFESKGRIIKVITKKDVRSFYGKLNDVEELLRKSKYSFMRIHQSYLVNYFAIEQMSYDKIKLFNGERLSISKEKQKNVKKEYMNILGGSSVIV